jgi:two-component system CheB/CheR fusion protein
VPEVVWRRLFEHAPDPQLVTEPRGRVLAANPAATRLLDSVDSPLLGSRLAALVVEADRSRIRALLRRLREAGPEALESDLDFRVPGGNTMTVSATLLGLHDEEGHLEAVSWALRQMGQPRTLVGRLQRTRQEASDLRRALDQSAAVLELDRLGRISEVNERCTRLLRRPYEQMVGCTVAELGLGPHLGESLPEIRRRLVRGRSWGGELPVVVEGDEARWINATVVPLLDEDGRPRRYLALLHDVTRRRQALERLEQQRGLARIGAMAAVVAHEVRNPLAATQGALEVIGPRVPAEDDRAVLADVIERLSRLNRLVDEILLYARPRPLKLEESDVGEVAYRVIEELRDDPGMERIEITLERPPEGCPLRLDPDAIGGALLNLVQNAAAATEGRGRVQVVVERDEGWWRLRVRDEGAGVPEELREKIFEPFFTTRPEGSGLGLTVARHTVEQHGGRLRLEAVPGGGTDAVVELPAGEAAGPIRDGTD